MSVRLIHGALDETEDGQIILRGRIDPTSLGELQVPEYQREVLSNKKIGELQDAFKNGKSVPDIDLGMRGPNFDSKGSREDGDVFLLHDPIFIIDGLQRRTAALRCLTEGTAVRLGALVHFETTEEWERERFRKLNQERTRLSQNILLRNARHDSAAVETLYNLTFDSSFVMNGRVSWEQSQRREQLISATTYFKVIATLHGHLVPGKSNDLTEITTNLDKLMERVGRNTMRDNVRAYFDAIDTAWGIRSITWKEGAIYLRDTFIRTLARVMSEHVDFWRDSRLVIEKPVIDRLKTLNLQDPTTMTLASGTGQSWVMLSKILVDQLNYRRTKRLRARVA